MPQPWSAVAASPAFQALPPDQQEAARQQYFTQVVAPKVPAAQRDAVQQQFNADTARTTVPQSPQDKARAAGQSTGAQQGSLISAIRGAAHAGTFGLDDYVNGAARYAGQRLTGVQNPDDFSTDVAYSQGLDQGSASEHPVANVAGNVAGVFMGGGALSAGAKAAESLPVVGNAAKAINTALETRAGQPIRNTVRLAVPGAAVAGAQSAINGDTPTNIATNAAIGSVLGPTVGAAASRVVKAVAPLPMKTARVLAQVFGMGADDMSTAWSDFTAASGRPPTMREISDITQAAKIKTTATDNPALGNSLVSADDVAGPARAQHIASQFAQDAQNRPVMSSADLEQWTKQAGDKEFGAVRDQTFNVAPEDRDWLMGEVLPAASLSRTARRAIGAELDNGQMSVNSADVLRRNLRSLAASRPGEGFYEMGNDVNDIAAGAVPAYRAAVQNYAKRAQITEGAKLGEQVLNGGDTLGFLSDVTNAKDFQKLGVPRGAQAALYNAAQTPQGATQLSRRLATDDGLYKRISSTLGQGTADKLKALGAAESTAADRLTQSSPRAPLDTDAGGSGIGTAAHAVGAAALHSTTGVSYHILQAVKALPGVQMPQAVQHKVAQYLTDPKMTQQGINLLRRAGAADADLRRLSAGLSASTGGAVSNTHMMAQ